MNTDNLVGGPVEIRFLIPQAYAYLFLALAELTGSTKLENKPSTNSFSDDGGSLSSVGATPELGDPEIPTGVGPFGPCPKCGVGEVRRMFHKNNDGNHLQCSLRNWNNPESCQWTAWTSDEQVKYFMSLKTQDVRSGSGDLSHIQLAQEVIKELQKIADTEKRFEVIQSYGYQRGASWLVFCNALSDTNLRSILNELKQPA